MGREGLILTQVFILCPYSTFISFKLVFCLKKVGAKLVIRVILQKCEIIALDYPFKVTQTLFGPIYHYTMCVVLQSDSTVCTVPRTGH